MSWAFDWPSSPDSLSPSPGQRAAAELLSNHRRSDHAIAEAARCSHSTVAHVRHLLEEDGLLELLEASARATRTRIPSPLPPVPDLPPPPPELRAGLCVSHPRPQIWNATRNPTLRAEATGICQRCPVLAPCGSWILSMPAYTDRMMGVVAAMTIADRDRIRRARREAAARDRAARAATPPRPRKRPARPAKEPRP